MKEIIDAKGMNRSITRIAHEIVEKNKGAENIVLIGIKRRGEHLARRLAEKISAFEDIAVPFTALDITYWRDDLDSSNLDKPQLEINVDGKVVIIVDDVLYSGRTIRACMDGIMDYGRPAEIHLAVLVDRGHRELPIRADYVGKNVPSSKDENVNVMVEEIDGLDSIQINKK